MTSINAMKKKLSQLEAEKAAIIAKVSETARKIRMRVNMPLGAR